MNRNILIGQSGGPSAAINATLAGIIKKARETESINKIYGALNGIHGVLEETIVDLEPYSDDYHLNIMAQTPAMALGSCRHKLTEENFHLVEEVLKKYEIDTFFYIGGNDSMDTVLRLDRYFKQKGSNIKIIGVPKTIDNDLPISDHTPGYGSSAKYLYHTMSEIIRDSIIYPVKNVVIVEIMGRNSGWLTLAAGLPRFIGNKAPHIIAIPEVSFDENEFSKKVETLLKTENTVICVVSEGIVDKNGNYIGMEAKSGEVDTFGHTYLSGVGKYLEGVVLKNIGCKVRSIELNVMQRCSSHLASKTDIAEALLIGQAAVEYSLKGQSGITLVFHRVSSNPYKVEISSTDVINIANLEKDVPEEWFNLEDEKVQKEISEYILPLISGDLEQIKDETGLPIYIHIK